MQLGSLINSNVGKYIVFNYVILMQMYICRRLLFAPNNHCERKINSAHEIETSYINPTIILYLLIHLLSIITLTTIPHMSIYIYKVPSTSSIAS